MTKRNSSHSSRPDRGPAHLPGADEHGRFRTASRFEIGTADACDGRPLTIAVVQSKLREIGMTMRKTGSGEFRVNFRGAHEGAAYYATDLADALLSGRHMAELNERRLIPLGYRD